MQNTLRNSTLLKEEKRTTIWFLWLFYIIFFVYDIIYNFLIPENPLGANFEKPSFGIGYIIYIALVAFIPMAYYLLKNDKPWPIKYIIFIGFTGLNVINDVYIYWGNDAPYGSGNVVEIVIILFAPIFVNKKFFYLVSLGTFSKYLIVGVVIQDTMVVSPLVMVAVLASISYIVLTRFISYVDSVMDSYSRQLEGIVKGVIATLELKDPYTRGHSERVADYALDLAKQSGRFREEELKSFYYACLLHDIGKINIPDTILSKPGRLTKEEFDIIKTHPNVGARAVQDVVGISDNIGVIKHHHERWDGKGYPDGLEGEETDYLTRVIAIADAFDAMTSSRSYRAALPLEKAYQQIIEGKGTQFDPSLVEIFKDVFPKWVIYHESHNTPKDYDQSASTT